jgi:uncharacterized protein involved in outer membrane biogenesis
LSAVPCVRRVFSGRRGGAWFKLLVTLAVIFAALALAWMLFLPAVVTAQLRQRTGFDATVQRLVVNPLTGTVELRGLVVTNPPTFPVADFVELREFRADADVFSLFSDRAVFNSMLLDVASVTLVKREDGVSNAEAFQQHLTATDRTPSVPRPAPTSRRFLVRQLTVRMDRLVIADHSTRLPRSREYRLRLNQSYRDVTDVKQLLAPAALQSLAPVAEALTGLVPGDLGQAIGDTVKNATKAGEKLLRSTGRKAGEKVKGYFDALEESRKP